MLEEPSSAEVPAEVPTTLPEFVDAEGRRWRLRWTIGLARAVREKLSLDFLNAHNGKAVSEIAHNTEQLVNVLWELCASQAEQADVDVDSFVAALDGDALGRASDAILEALVLFSMPAERPAMRAVIGRLQELQARESELKVQKVAGPAGTKLLDRTLAAASRAIDRKLDTAASQAEREVDEILFDFWEAVEDAAGVLGIDPDPLSWGRLFQRWRARLCEAWDHTASLTATLLNCHRADKHTRPFHPAEFHPFHRRRPRREPLTPERLRERAAAWREEQRRKGIAI